MYLIDTNVFLEALLEQEKTLIVKSFLQSIEVEQMFMTDLTLHSIGIILFRLNKSELFLSFLENVIIDRIRIISLEANELKNVKIASQSFQLDFDDAYQYAVADKYDLQFDSFDKHFDHTKRGRKSPSDLIGLPSFSFLC